MNTDLFSSKTPRGRHHTKILPFRDRKVRVDVAIAPMLSKMWKLNINTFSSCQANCSFICDHKMKAHPKDENGMQHFEKIPGKNCRNNIWLAFETCGDLERLLNVVAEYDEKDGSMYHKMGCDRFINRNDHRTQYTPKDAWQYHFYMGNAGVQGHWGRPMWGTKRSTQECWIEDGCEENNFVIQPQLTFPQKHLQYVESRLDLALGQKK